MKTSKSTLSIGEIDYTPPASSKWSGLVAGFGVALFTGPLWGFLWTVLGMIRAFNTIAENNPAPRQALAGDIHIAFVATMVGIPVGLIGAVLIFIALFATKFRKPWFFHNSITLALFWCVAVFPVGLFIGLPVISSFIFMRAEFRKRKQNKPRLATATSPIVSDDLI